jgi:ankyrin repeat protein
MQEWISTRTDEISPNTEETTMPDAPALEEFIAAARRGDAAAIDGALAADPALASARTEGGDSALLQAAYYGQAAVVSTLLRHAEAPTLFEACAAGAFEPADRILRDRPEAARDWSHDGWTALHLAAFFGHRPLVELLLPLGPEMEAVSRNPLNVTPLQSALANGHAEIAALLIERGADVEARASAGWAPLLYAAYNNLPETARLLLARGADPARTSPEGKTALQVAEEKGHAEVVAVLRG